jgi:hypothetical protein
MRALRYFTASACSFEWWDSISETVTCKKKKIVKMFQKIELCNNISETVMGGGGGGGKGGGDGEGEGEGEGEGGRGGLYHGNGIPLFLHARCRGLKFFFEYRVFFVFLHILFFYAGRGLKKNWIFFWEKMKKKGEKSYIYRCFGASVYENV